MKGIKAKDLRAHSIEELNAKVTEERQAIFLARRDLVFRRITDRTAMRTRRQNIAKILTVIGEKKRAGEA